MMSFPASPHPLDTELVDYVDGVLGAADASLIQAHLESCLLCRVKRQRLTALPPLQSIDVRTLRIPSFGRVETHPAAGSTARPGELWLTASDPAAIVLVRKVRDHDWGLVVVPATLDVEVADSGTLILDETASPIGTPIGIYEHLTISLPSSALAERIVPTRPDVDLLGLVDGDPGVTHGTALRGSADPRHEVRQYLTDQLVRLDLHEPVNDDEDGASGDRDDVEAASEEWYVALRDDLDPFGQRPYLIEALALAPHLRSFPEGWRGIARVSHLHLTVVVIQTPAGLIDAPDRLSAQILLTRLGGSALLVWARGSDIADLYDPATLYGARRVSDGQRASEPIISGLSPADTIHKFFDQRQRWSNPVNTTQVTVAKVDVRRILAAQTAASTDATAKTGARARTDGKPEGYAKAASLSAELAAVLETVLDGTFDPQHIAELVPEDEP